jgi:hypothetical protein
MIESNGENFEYEGMESSDEGSFESDESDEASFESDESDEASFESDESREGASFESDESFSAFESDESDESDEVAESDESDESDESSDEALSASAQARADANVARRRRAAFALSVKRDQRREAERAAAARKRFATQLKGIPAGGKAVGRLQGAGYVTAVLDNGRKARMRLIPAPATNVEVNRLRATFNANDKRQARAIAKLKSAQAAFITRQTAEMVKSDKAISQKIVQSHSQLDKKITNQLTLQRSMLEKHRKRVMRVVKKQRWRQLANSALLAEGLWVFSTYGDRRELLSSRNLALGGSLVGALVLDDVVDAFTGKAGGAWSGLTGAWSYAALVAYPTIVHLALKDRESRDLISGVTPATPGQALTSIPVPVATKFTEQFRTNTTNKSIPVLASVVGGGAAANRIINARVHAGNLEITFEAAPAAGTNVAWVVDVQAAT